MGNALIHHTTQNLINQHQSINIPLKSNLNFTQSPQLRQDLSKSDNNLAAQLRNARLDRERKKTPTSPKRRDNLYKIEHK